MPKESNVVWIHVGDLCVRIERSGEGVMLNAYPFAGEVGRPLLETYIKFPEKKCLEK